MLNNKPAVSVIMAVYNGEKLLDKSVESILQQTLEDFELVIVDDGSTDGTRDKVKEFCLKDSRVVLVENPVNSGLATSLNNGIRAARGEYLARMDADDESYQQRLQHQKDFLDTHPEVAVVGGNADYINQAETMVRKTALPLSSQAIRKKLMRMNPLIHPTVMFRREFIERTGGYDEKHRRKEDYDLWLRGSRQFEYANLEESLIRYQAKDSKIFSADLYAFYIRILNAFRLGQYFTGTYWAIVTLGINILRKFGYKQRIFRQDD